MIARGVAGSNDFGQSSSPDASAPTALRMALGAQLRQLREARGITREAAGDAIRGSDAKISRMELGRVGLKDRDVRDLLTLYGILDLEQRDEFLSLVAKANTAGWWHEFNSVTPRWFEMYLGLEQSASVIRTYEVQFVPGLLQTAEYAREVVTLGQFDADEVQHRIELRLRRQQLLSRPDAPTVWAVVEENVLRRPTASRAVMRAQLEYLIHAAEQPHITLQLVPQRFAGHPVTGVPFTILRFDGPELPDIVYLEQLTGALYLDKRKDVEQYAAAMNSLCAHILTPDDSATALRSLIDEI